MFTLHCSQKDVERYQLAELQNAKNAQYYRPTPIRDAAEKFERRERRKLYGVSKYRADGTLYIEQERPWIFK